ncbi:MAG TPA: hypothetical protein VGA56_03810 [Opitutaceae bacterium]
MAAGAPTALRIVLRTNAVRGPASTELRHRTSKVVAGATTALLVIRVLARKQRRPGAGIHLN